MNKKYLLIFSYRLEVVGAVFCDEAHYSKIVNNNLIRNNLQTSSFKTSEIKSITLNYGVIEINLFNIGMSFRYDSNNLELLRLICKKAFK